MNQVNQSKVRLLYDRIGDVSNAIVPLYDDIQNMIFHDINYYDFIDYVPTWMSDAGRCAESITSKDAFEKHLVHCTEENTFRLLYWFDLQGLLGAMQDRISDIRSLLWEFYKILPYENKYAKEDYTAASRHLNDSATHAQALVNNIFVSLASAFDLYSKICYEVSHLDQYSFDKYTKLKSRQKNILYTKTLDTFAGLKSNGLLLSEPVCIRKVLSFRDEFIHNGSWDYRCAIYETMVGDEPADVFMLSPDMEPNGCFCTSGARNKFYSQDNRINILLIPLLHDVLDVIEQSVSALRVECQKTTKVCDEQTKADNAKKYIKMLIALVSKELLSLKTGE